ncbi:hypothetical protein BD309DRAFT_953809 [Dichomitus squalens]|nr:hypothetical protein BD309DRAFT_953809 [Dichomitus squalens]
MGQSCLLHGLSQTRFWSNGARLADRMAKKLSVATLVTGRVSGLKKTKSARSVVHLRCLWEETAVVRLGRGVCCQPMLAT